MASTKKAPVKKPVAAKKPVTKAATPRKTIATKAKTAAKPKKVAAKKAPVDYRLNAIRKLASAFEDKQTREVVEQACLEISRQAHAMFVARSDDGIAYRNYLKAVSHMSFELANAAATGDEDSIETAIAGISDELDGSPILDLAWQYNVTHGRAVVSALQGHLRREEIDMAFMLR